MERVLSVSSHSLDGKKIDPKHATPKSKSKANKVTNMQLNYTVIVLKSVRLELANNFSVSHFVD